MKETRHGAVAVGMTGSETLGPTPRPILGATAVFLACLYARPVALDPALGRLPVLTAAAGLGLLTARVVLGRAPLVLGGRLAAAVFGLAALVAVSVGWSISPADTTSVAVDVARILAAYVLVLNAVRRAADARVLMWALVLGSAVPSLGTVQNYLNGVVVAGEVDRYAWRDLFTNPNDLAYGLAVAVPLALSLREATRSRLARALLVVLVAVHAGAITLSGSRGGMLGLGAGLLGWTVFRPGSRPLRAVPFAVALALAGVLTTPSVTWERFSAGFSDTRDASFQTRLNAWDVGFRVAADRPLSGSGAGTFARAWSIYAPLDYGATAYSAHNSYVQAMAELGLPGLGVFLTVVAFGLSSLWGLRRRAGAAGSLASGLAGGFLAFLVCSLGGGHLYSWFPYMVLAMGESLAIFGDRP